MFSRIHINEKKPHQIKMRNFNDQSRFITMLVGTHRRVLPLFAS